MSVKRQPTCGDISLDVLLFGDEQSGEFQDSADHVESCARCQRELTRLAGDDGDWSEVRQALGDGAADASSDESAPRGRAAPRYKLDFLSPPSHPEMLGRLGRYEIESVIGAGGFGIVLKGFDTELNRPVAIKVLAPHLAHSGPARQRFAREARAAAAVVHEHVVAIHNVESDGEVPFLVMQYVPGAALQDRVDQHGPLQAIEILRIGMQAAAGLAAAHAQGLIHRDVKPANILLENGVERVLLTDFGLARAADDASLTHSGIVAGTPHYMSPEQADGRAVDARSDLFSLGAVLYFMATGHPPFRAERAMAVLHRICHDRHRPIHQICPQMPDELVDVMDRLLEKKPSRRFATAAEVEEALARAISAFQHPRGGRARRWLRRRRRTVWLGTAAAALGLAIIASSAYWGQPQSTIAPAPESPAQKTPPSAVSDAQITAEMVDFQDGLVTLHRSLDHIEASLYPESIALQYMGDSWSAALEHTKRAVSELEESWSIGSDRTSAGLLSDSEKEPSEGEKR